MRLTDKSEFYRLSQQLLLGNRLRHWTYEEFLAEHPEDLPPLIGIRYKDGTRRSGTGLHTYGDALRLASQTLDKSILQFDEGAPHQRLTLQGELTTDTRGLYLRYSRHQLHQRELWKLDDQLYEIGTTCVSHARGLLATSLLQVYLDPISRETINEILAAYDDCVVEFSTFSRPVGVLGWNTLIWEVRTGW